MNPTRSCDPADPSTHRYGSGVEQPDGGRRWVCAGCGDVLTVSGASLRMHRIYAEESARDTESVRQIGARIGYGNLMHCASTLWAEESRTRPGGHVVVGPCAAMTVPCGCEHAHECAWCGGTSWLTKRVKQAKEEAAHASMRSGESTGGTMRLGTPQGGEAE